MTENRYEFNVVNRIKSLRQLIDEVRSDIKHLSTESWKLDAEISEINKVIGYLDSDIAVDALTQSIKTKTAILETLENQRNNSQQNLEAYSNQLSMIQKDICPHVEFSEEYVGYDTTYRCLLCGHLF